VENLGPKSQRLIGHSDFVPRFDEQAPRELEPILADKFLRKRYESLRFAACGSQGPLGTLDGG
jgi:hypothetical protein